MDARSEPAYSARALSSDLWGREGPSGAVVGGAYVVGELDVNELTGVVGREPERDICKGFIDEAPGAEDGWRAYGDPLVTEGERRRVGKGGALDMERRV